METWKPTSKSEIEAIIKKQLEKCTDDQKEYFKTVCVEPYQVQLLRFGQLEKVFVVATKDSEVTYFEDVENGFNIAPISTEGKLLEHFDELLNLTHVLYRWVNHLDSPR